MGVAINSWALASLCCLLVSMPVLGQTATPSAPKSVIIASIEVKGSRIPAASVIRLTQLTIGQHADEKTLREACAKANQSGLFTDIHYDYDLYPDRPEIALVLVVADEGPLFPATIKGVDENQAWAWLQKLDPLFTRELPRTRNAMRLYEANLEKYLQSIGRDEGITSEVTSDNERNPVGILFQAVKLHPATPPAGQKR